MNGFKMKLEIKQLIKNYGSFTALDHISYTFENGIYALLGPNGAGKSTFMNILAMLLKETQGEIILDGKPLVKQKKSFLNMLGYMPQQQCLYEDFTLKDFMYYIGNLKGMKKQEIISRSQYLVKEVKLEDVFYKKLSAFSGGMKQRAMLAATLINDPKILILDEPTAGLDPMKRMEMQNMIASFAKDKIVLIATHVVSDVEFISSKFIFLKEGHIILQGDRISILECLDQKVKEREITVEEYQKYKQANIVSSIYYRHDKLFARIIDDDQEYSGEVVTPEISDVYFYLFRDEKDAVL